MTPFRKLEFIFSWCDLQNHFSLNKSLFTAICKSRHWNLGIGIGIGTGIGTDITNAIISSSIRPMDPNLSRVVT